MNSIKQTLVAATFLLVSGACSSALADNGATTLKAGEIACLTLKDAQNYTNYLKDSPAFAEDLINRAACFVSKEDMQAVAITSAKNYNKIKLLSGHTVWVPKR